MLGEVLGPLNLKTGRLSPLLSDLSLATSYRESGLVHRLDRAFPPGAAPTWRLPWRFLRRTPTGRAFGPRAGIVIRAATRIEPHAAPDGPTLAVPSSRAIGSQVTVALRPESIALASPAAEDGDPAPNTTPQWSSR